MQMTKDETINYKDCVGGTPTPDYLEYRKKAAQVAKENLESLKDNIDKVEIPEEGSPESSDEQDVQITVSTREHRFLKPMIERMTIEKLLRNPQKKDEEDYDINKYRGLSSLRVEALKIATDMALKINHFEPNYSTHSDPLEALLKDVDIVHKIADRNLKYIMGEK